MDSLNDQNKASYSVKQEDNVIIVILCRSSGCYLKVCKVKAIFLLKIVCRYPMELSIYVILAL